jgi:hypothetical protein
MEIQAPISPGRGPHPAFRRFRNWDWLLLPALSGLTILCLATMDYSADRHFFTEWSQPGSHCLDLDAPNGPRAVPNSVCWIKTAESQPIEYRFNSCGHRTPGECGVKPAGSYRIVMIGSSSGMGFAVPIGKSFATLLPAGLSNATHKNVELYNESLQANRPWSILLHFREALDAHPDLILWALTPSDIEHDGGPQLELDKGPPGLFRHARWLVEREFSIQQPLQFVAEIPGILRQSITDSRIGTPLYDLVIQSQSEYMRLRLLDQRGTGYLRTDSDAFWRARLLQLDKEVAQMETLANAAGVPMLTVLLPNREQAAMISMGNWSSGYDPYKIGDEVRSMALRHGGAYIDILPGFRDIPNPEQDYLPLDGHPTARAHAIFAKLIVQQLTSGAVPALEAVNPKP